MIYWDAWFCKIFLPRFQKNSWEHIWVHLVWNVEKEKKVTLFSSKLNNWSKVDNKHSKMGWDLIPWLVLRYIFPGQNSPPLMLNTVGCHYNAVRYNMILHTSLQWLRPNINQSFSTQTKLWGVFCENFEENRPGYNGTAVTAPYYAVGEFVSWLSSLQSPSVRPMHDMTSTTPPKLFLPGGGGGGGGILTSEFMLPSPKSELPNHTPTKN